VLPQARQKIRRHDWPRHIAGLECGNVHVSRMLSEISIEGSLETGLPFYCAREKMKMLGSAILMAGVLVCGAWAIAADKQKDIVDTAVGADSFKTLVAAVKAADLVETLKGEGPFTVFAPTDEAFAKLPKGTLDSLLKPENKEKLQAILTYHVVPGDVRAADVVKLKEAKTVQGQMLKIDTKDGVKVNNASVVKTDIVCTNGVIHVIDTVVLPE
jgi:uncharacterized surface protein with fasciclin (FAS1) repeats